MQALILHFCLYHLQRLPYHCSITAAGSIAALRCSGVKSIATNDGFIWTGLIVYLIDRPWCKTWCKHNE